MTPSAPVVFESVSTAISTVKTPFPVIGAILPLCRIHLSSKAVHFRKPSRHGNQVRKRAETKKRLEDAGVREFPRLPRRQEANNKSSHPFVSLATAITLEGMETKEDKSLKLSLEFGADGVGDSLTQFRGRARRKTPAPRLSTSIRR